MARKLIIDQLDAYLEGNTSLSEFHRYLAPIVWDVEQLEQDETISLVYLLELWIAEYTSGHRSIADLKYKFVEERKNHVI